MVCCLGILPSGICLFMHLRSTLMRLITLTLVAAFLSSCAIQKAEAYHLAQTVPVAGNGRWDLITVDEAARRVYVSHETQVNVLDADTGKPVAEIDGLLGVHGIALAADSGQGFITNGKRDSVTIFDMKSFKKVGEVKTGKKPDAITYDPATHRIFVMNGDSDSSTVIDPSDDKVIGTIALKGGPEFPVPDNKGHVFVNLENEGELLRIDSPEMKVLNRWSVAPGKAPAGLAMDRTNQRLFIGCGNRKLIVMDALSGKVIADLPLGDHVDATAYDPETKQIISSNNDGTMTVVQQDDADHYHVAQTVTTPNHSKTLGLDLKTHKLFVPAAEFGPIPPATKANPKRRPDVIAGTFKVLVFEK